MKMRHSIYILLLLISFANKQLSAQAFAPQDIYEAFVKSDIKLWEKAVKNCEARANLSKEKDQLELIHYYYGYASTLIGKKEHEKAKQIIVKANQLIDSLLEKNPKNAHALNYKGVFMGYEVAINKLKAMQLGHKSVKLINDALNLASNDEQILFDKANTLYYTPAVFGGNKKEALLYYQKARKQIENRGKVNKNWIYLQVLFAEAHCRELTNDLSGAKAAYEHVLRLEPNYKLVKEKYYPNLLKKLAN